MERRMDSKRTSLTTQLRNGELEHVVTVAGKPAQAHASLKAAMSALLLAMALGGCQTMRDHPRTTAFIASSLALSAGMAYRSHARSDEPRMSVPLTPDCARYPEQCR
jgi:hypothetical protein